MDDVRFDALVRVLGADAPRRRVLAGLLASLPLALGGREAAAKKCKKGKKKCGKKCIPKSKCCTSATCGPNETCTNGTCTCTPNCTGKECGADGCGDVCGACDQGDTCTPQGQCVCAPQCAGKTCGDNGCGGSCGSCGTGRTCDAQGQCVCQQGYICGGAVPWCNAQQTCGCTAVLEGGTVCGADLCALNEICQSTEFCVGKYGSGFVCQAPNTGCCGQRCVAPCGFTPGRSARERDGRAGEQHSLAGRNIRESRSSRKN